MQPGSFYLLKAHANNPKMILDVINTLNIDQLQNASGDECELIVFRILRENGYTADQANALMDME